MQLNASIEGLDLAQQMVTIGFSPRRAAAALATGLTWTAKEIKDAEQQGLAQDLDRPTPYTLRSLFMQGATANRLTAKVWLKDDLAGSGTPAATFLTPQIQGGARQIKRFEYALQTFGLMPHGWVAVPGQGARLDAYGNVSIGQIQQILSQLRVQVLSGSDRRLPARVNKSSPEYRKTNTKRRRAFGRAGGQFFAVPKQRGKLRPGIYLHAGRDFGARLGYGRSGRIQAVFSFRPAVTYRPTLAWQSRAEQIINTRLGPNVQRAISASLQRLQAGAVTQATWSDVFGD